MRYRKILIGLCFFIAVGQGVAATKPGETVLPQPPAAGAVATAGGIPYKHESKSFAEQSLSTFFITLLLLGGTVAGLYYFRNYLQKKTGHTFLKPSAIQIKERIRVSQKLTMYVVAYRNKEILIAQTGDSVTPITEFITGQASSTQAPDHIQCQPE